MACSFYCFRVRDIVCGATSIVSFSNDRPCLESYRVSLLIRSGRNESCHLFLPLDIDECGMFPLCYNGRCQNMPGMFRCLCDNGFQLDKQGTNCTGVSSEKSSHVLIVTYTSPFRDSKQRSFISRHCSRGLFLESPQNLFWARKAS